MTLNNYDVGEGASFFKLQACGLVVELWKILLAFGFYILYNLYNLCNLCRWMFRGSGWVSVGLVWAGREYAWEAPQMGLHHAWLALKAPAFLPTTSAPSPSPPCHQAVFQVKVGSTLPPSHNVSFMIAICVWFCDKIKLPMLHWQKRNADYLHWQSHSCRRCCWSVSTCGRRQPEKILIIFISPDLPFVP